MSWHFCLQAFFRSAQQNRLLHNNKHIWILPCYNIISYHNKNACIQSIVKLKNYTSEKKSLNYLTKNLRLNWTIKAWVVFSIYLTSTISKCSHFRPKCLYRILDLHTSRAEPSSGPELGLAIGYWASSTNICFN